VGLCGVSLSRTINATVSIAQREKGTLSVPLYVQSRSSECAGRRISVSWKVQWRGSLNPFGYHCLSFASSRSFWFCFPENRLIYLRILRAYLQPIGIFVLIFRSTVNIPNILTSLMEDRARAIHDFSPTSIHFVSPFCLYPVKSANIN
jgi:hypothetical protein